MNMKTWIPFLGILLNLNLFFAAAVTGQDIVNAIRDGDLAAIQGFIDAGVNFNQSVTDAYTPLIYAIECDRIEIARAILAAPRTNINFPSRSGSTPISCAVKQCKDEMIRLLLADERCARNEHVDLNRTTPLHIAARRGNTSTVQTLLEDPRVDRNIIGGSGSTALDYAIENVLVDTAIVLLNDPHVVKNRIDRNGMTILHKMAHQLRDFHEYRRDNRLRILEAVLHVGGIDINHQDHRGKTALHCAAQWGDPEMILRLIAAGADSSIEDESGRNALYYAEQRALASIYLEALDFAIVGLK